MTQSRLGQHLIDSVQTWLQVFKTSKGTVVCNDILKVASIIIYMQLQQLLVAIHVSNALPLLKLKKLHFMIEKFCIFVRLFFFFFRSLGGFYSSEICTFLGHIWRSYINIFMSKNTQVFCLLIFYNAILRSICESKILRNEIFQKLTLLGPFVFKITNSQLCIWVLGHVWQLYIQVFLFKNTFDILLLGV